MEEDFGFFGTIGFYTCVIGAIYLTFKLMEMRRLAAEHKIRRVRAEVRDLCVEAKYADVEETRQNVRAKLRHEIERRKLRARIDDSQSAAIQDLYNSLADIEIRLGLPVSEHYVDARFEYGLPTSLKLRAQSLEEGDTMCVLPINL